MRGTPDRSMLARSLYLQMRALGLEVRAIEDSDGDLSDYRLLVAGLERLNSHVRRSIERRIRRSETELVELILTRRDLDLRAIRLEGNICE